MKSSLGLWHYHLPKSDTHLLLNRGRNPGEDIRILQSLCYVLAQCCKDSFHHKTANNGPPQEQKDVSNARGACLMLLGSGEPHLAVNSLRQQSECQMQLKRLPAVAAVVDVWSPTQCGSLALSFFLHGNIKRACSLESLKCAKSTQCHAVTWCETGDLLYWSFPPFPFLLSVSLEPSLVHEKNSTLFSLGREPGVKKQRRKKFFGSVMFCQVMQCLLNPCFLALLSKQLSLP